MTPLRFAELTWRHRHASAAAYGRWFERHYGHDLDAYLAGYDDAGAGLPSAARSERAHARCRGGARRSTSPSQTPEEEPIQSAARDGRGRRLDAVLNAPLARYCRLGGTALRPGFPPATDGRRGSRASSLAPWQGASSAPDASGAITERHRRTNPNDSMAHPAHSLSAVSPSGDIHTAAGTRIPEAEVRARQIAREAGLLANARRPSAPGCARSTLDAKALGACAFSVHHAAASLAVPSKLVGTSRHQGVLRSLAGDPGATWRALDLAARGDDLVVSAGGTRARPRPAQAPRLGPTARALRSPGLPLPRDRHGRGGATASAATSPSATSAPPSRSWQAPRTAGTAHPPRTAAVRSVSSCPASRASRRLRPVSRSSPKPSP